MKKIAAEYIDINTLKPWDKNPRKNDHAVPEIVASIERFGFSSPIIARKSDNVIIAGHTRWKAAKQIGLKEVPVRFMDLDVVDSQLLAIADNKLNERATWDDNVLEQVLNELAEEDLTGLGFDDDELDNLLQSTTEDPKDENEDLPELEEEVHSQVGEIYELGSHLLVCGDWRTEELRQKAFNILTPTAGMMDPPYGISVVSKNGTVFGSKPVGTVGGSNIVKANQYAPIFEDDVDFDPTDLLNILSNTILWGANYYSDKLKNTKGWIVWDKKCQEWDDNFSDGELAWSPFDKPLKIYRHQWMGIIQQGKREKRVHPTQKPSQLIAKIINDYFPEDDVIADFFLGSGTTLLACAYIKKKCIGFEIMPEYCDVIRRRWTRYAKENGLEVGSGGLE
jgi:hypothetical protein